MAVEAKKVSLIRVLEVLKKYSDENHKLTHKDIIRILEEEYSLKLERKAVASNLERLKECGYDIIQTENGSYMNSREFEDSELRMLIDGVLGSKYITVAHSLDIIDKLCDLSNTYFKSRIKHIYTINDWNKTDNYSLFYNIEMIDEAIQQKRRINYDYNKYGADMELHKSSQQTVSPYQLILHNQRYYLMAYSEYWGNMVFHRLDHITNMSITEERATPVKRVPGYEKGIDYKEISSMMPYMYADRLETIAFKADAGIIDHIVDWFGNAARISECTDEEDKVLVKVKASPNAMEHWVMQYINSVEVTAPEHFRERIRKVLENGLKKYK